MAVSGTSVFVGTGDGTGDGRGAVYVFTPKEPALAIAPASPFSATISWTPVDWPGFVLQFNDTLGIISNVIDLDLGVAEAVAAPRIHHQWSPDEVSAERGLPADVIRALEARGHKVRQIMPGTSANSILVTPQGFVGAADRRTRGAPWRSPTAGPTSSSSST